MAAMQSTVVGVVAWSWAHAGGACVARPGPAPTKLHACSGMHARMSRERGCMTSPKACFSPAPMLQATHRPGPVKAACTHCQRSTAQRAAAGARPRPGRQPNCAASSLICLDLFLLCVIRHKPFPSGPTALISSLHPSPFLPCACMAPTSCLLTAAPINSASLCQFAHTHTHRIIRQLLIFFHA